MTPRVFIPLGLLAVCLLLVGSASAFLAGYGYYQDVTLNNTGSNLTNYQVMFVVNTSSGTSSGTTIYLNSHSEADLDDLRFTTTGDTVYDYWVESAASPYNVWVEVPSIPAGNSTMRVQYGNAAASAASNGTNTFIVFDDFADGNYNSNPIWTVSTGTWDASTNLLKQTNSAASFMKIYTPCDQMDVAITATVKAYTYSGIIVRKGTKEAGLRFNIANQISFENPGVSAYKTLSQAWTAGNTYKLTLAAQGNNFYFYLGDSYLDTYNTGDISNTGNVGLYTYGTGSATFDNIYVRNYTATLPTAPAWSGEGTTSAAPVAAFSGTPTSGATPLTVTFTDASTNTPTSWAWSWDDGTANGTTQNPSHQFTSAGTYTITLTATNADGSDTETKVDYITVCDTPVAAFSANVTSGTIPLYVAFTDATTGTPASWAWSFDDGGANSTAQNPTRTFSATGTYTITLTATNCGGSDGETKVDYIQAYELTAFPGCAAPPNDLDADGYYEDINGNGRIDWADLIVFFTHLAWAQANQPPAFFDFANDGGTITYADVTALYPIVAGGA